MKTDKKKLLEMSVAECLSIELKTIYTSVFLAYNLCSKRIICAYMNNVIVLHPSWCRLKFRKCDSTSVFYYYMNIYIQSDIQAATTTIYLCWPKSSQIWVYEV